VECPKSKDSIRAKIKWLWVGYDHSFCQQI